MYRYLRLIEAAINGKVSCYGLIPYMVNFGFVTLLAPENESKFVDVVEKCLRCPFYLGVFVRRKLWLACNLRIDAYHKRELRHSESLSELLQLYDKVKRGIDD